MMSSGASANCYLLEVSIEFSNAMFISLCMGHEDYLKFITHTYTV